jgi:predicted nucleotidyltransferase component of viral defense system
MRSVADRNGLDIAVRSWRDTTSFELKERGSKREVFSLQIARRTIELAPALESAWPPVKIEAFSDNLAAKMNALVDRGAPRDLVDVHEVCRRDLATIDGCWALWRRKNPGAAIDEAKLKVLHGLEALEARRPLHRIPDAAGREAARAVRDWVRSMLCDRSGSGHGA